MAIVMGLALYMWLWQSSNQARRQASTMVKSLRSQVLRVEQDAVEYERLRALPAVTASSTPLREVVQAQTDAAGLSKAQVRIDAPDPNRVQVAFGAVPFADWLTWLGNLQSQQIRLDTCRIEALSVAGMVSVTATLVRARQP